MTNWQQNCQKVCTAIRDGMYWASDNVNIMTFKLHFHKHIYVQKNVCKNVFTNTILCS